jgi:hypothetical protein
MGRRHVLICALTAFAPLAALALSESFQLEVVEGERRCLYQTVAPHTRVLVRCTVVDGDGDLNIGLTAFHPASQAAIYHDRAVAQTAFSFHTPEAREQAIESSGYQGRTMTRPLLPPLNQRALSPSPAHRSKHHVNGQAGELAERNDTYAFCFTSEPSGFQPQSLSPQKQTHPFISFRPFLAGRSSKSCRSRPKRKIIFQMATNVANSARHAQTAGLVKEAELSEADALLQAVRRRVVDILENYERTQRAAAHTDMLAQSCNSILAVYYAASCLAIVLSSAYTVYITNM